MRGGLSNEPRGPTPGGPRRDPILDGPSESADPLRSMCLFGITAQTAVRYVVTTRPDRTSKLPRYRSDR